MVFGFYKKGSEKLTMKRLLFLFMAVMSAACSSQHIESEKIITSKAGLQLQSANFSELKNFESDTLADAALTIMKTCDALIKKPNFLEQSELQIDVNSYLQVCEKFIELEPKNDETIRNFVRENFKPYKVLYNLQSSGKFTSYYEAEIHASRTKHGKYVYPVYGRPEDLIEINLRDFDVALPNRRLVMRIENQKAVPYYTRSEIEQSGVNAPVILWGDDPVDIYLMQIQGSAVAMLDDGSMLRVRYAENNGHAFAGIGGILLKKGLLKSGEASMDKIRDWLKANPKQAHENMIENPRFIFHGISEADGPIGAMGVTLTSGRSLAVDTKYIPLGSFLWLETVDPFGKPLQKLVVAQDIGGAIKGAVRGDYFWGHGEEALQCAGKMNSVGQYYILLPAKSEVKVRE